MKFSGVRRSRRLAILHTKKMAWNTLWTSAGETDNTRRASREHFKADNGRTTHNTAQSHFYSSHSDNTNTQQGLTHFWTHLYRQIQAKIDEQEQQNKDKKEDKIKYNIKVINVLNQFKKDKTYINETLDISETDLYSLQNEIELITMNFDEHNIFSQTPNLIRILIKDNQENAKSYLYKHLNEDLFYSYIDQLGHYTLEAIIIYVLGLLFNSIQESAIVRVSTLLDKLDSTVRLQANINNNDKILDLGDIKIKEVKKNKKDKDNQLAIGKYLLEFMIERKLIHIEKLTADDKVVVKEKGKGYFESNLYAVCDFDLSILPLRLNLPMVCKPVDWGHISEKEVLFVDLEIKKPFMLSDMVGGYLSTPTFNIYNTFHLISSRNINNFNIELDENRYKEMCHILNGLQNQGFKINKSMMEFLKKNRAILEKEGLFMPGILAHVNLKEAYDLMRREYYLNKGGIQQICSLSVLLKELANKVQIARYEDFIIRLASAYEDYVFYLPAFMDFRGRIYRAGVLHFHERDLARSLIVFNTHQEGQSATKDIIPTAAAYKYKKFHLYDDALQWYKANQGYYASDDNLISFAKGASDPFQFIAKVLCNEKESNRIPITQDAAASAYQIMSYLLLNEEMARRTNLIPYPDGKIQDVYMCLLHDLKAFLHHQISDKLLMEIIDSNLDRKLIKTLFMPLIYGKTVLSMEQDIRTKYGDLLSRKNSFQLAKLSNEFWSHKYPDIVHFMKLITIISWFCSAMDRAVVYSIPYLTTKQDYMSFVKEQITVYERTTKKKRRVTLSMPTKKRDKRKTQLAAFANFIHQKDAYIAMEVVNSLLREGAPIYTVHDNFITTPPYVRIVPDVYTKVFINMGPPLRIINEFISQNLIIPYSSSHHLSPLHFHDSQYPFPSDNLTDFLNSLRSPSMKETKKKWEKQVSDFVDYYQDYVDAVGCNQEKWNTFQKLLEKRSENYSVHY